MKSIVKYFLVILCITAFLSSFATADDLSEQLSKVGVQNVKSYVSPIFNGFSADLNSGFYHSADLHDVLGFDVGVKVGLARITDDDKKYDFRTPDFVNISVGGIQRRIYAGTDYDAVVPGVPTVVGDKDKQYFVKMKNTSLYYAPYTALNHGSDVLFELPKGYNLSAVPLPMPQLAIGLPFGLEIIGRYIPTVSAGDAGKFNYMGFGLRYDVGQWLPMVPLDLAVHFATQKLTFKSKDDKDIFSAKGTAFGLEASKRFFILTLYGGFQLESASFTLGKIDGSFKTPDGTETAFTIPETTFDGKNKSRFTLGVRLLLLFINVHADYSFAKTPVATLGLGISIR
jgi:hypothetical protein